MAKKLKIGAKIKTLLKKLKNWTKRIKTLDQILKIIFRYFFFRAEVEEDIYKLFYFKFAARMQPIVLLLEDAGIAYKMVDDEDFKSKLNKESPYTSHAVPIIEKGKRSYYLKI